MIKGREWRTLKGQLVLTGGMCGMALIAAIVMATQVRFAERFLREKKTPGEVPEEVKELITAARSGEIKRSEYVKLQPVDRGRLYEDWMNDESPAANSARAMMAVDAPFFASRVERTIVCGDAAQRQEALRFVLVAPARESLTSLEKLINWSHRRNLTELKELLRKTSEDLKKQLESAIKDGPD